MGKKPEASFNPATGVGLRVESSHRRLCGLVFRI